MKVTRRQIVCRGLANHCPNCGGATLFRKGALFDLNKACPACGLSLERDEGFFLGSMSLNYGVTLVCWLLPDMLLAYEGVIGVGTAGWAAGIGAVVFPALFYRSSRSWWLMQYYLVLPQQLPANQAEAAARTGAGDDNT